VDARRWLEQLETRLATASVDEAFAPLAFLAAQHVGIAEAELRAARRRALLVLAAGGDVRRALGPDEVAVRRLAQDLDRPERRAELAAALSSLADQARELPHVAHAVSLLRGDADLGWRWLACALLAEELVGEDG
jgi:hypothetical protein